MVISRLDDGCYVDVNDRWLRLIGMRREEVIGHSSLELSIWADMKDRDRMVQTLRENGAIRAEEIKFLNRSGAAFLGLLSAAALELNGEQCILSAVQDITEFRKLEDQLRQAQKLEAIGILAGGVAHDFNNLLSIILGRCELMETQRPATQSAGQDLEEIRKAAESATGLTRQLLAFSGRQVMELKVLDLNAIITETESMIRRLIGAHIQIELEMDPSLGRVKADPGQIEQVFLNLAVNARDAMPEGGKLMIRATNFDMDESYARAHPPAQPGPFVQLEIRDTGTGMDAETQARIFEPFFTTKAKGKGTGLGLATVYGIVKQSGGYIWVNSEVGKGTAFQIQLPRVAGALTERRLAPAPESRLRGSETVLVVEDDPAVRSVIREFLSLSGYQVLEAAGAAEAVEIAGQKDLRIDLLLTDMILPGKTGSALSRQIAELKPHTKTLFMSGYSEQTAGQEFTSGRRA